MTTVLRDTRTFKPNGATHGREEVWGDGQTTDNTATTIKSISVDEGEVAVIEGTLIGVQSDYTDAISATIRATARRAASGNVTEVGTSTVTIYESAAGTNATLNFNTTSQAVEVKGTGVTSETWNWEFFGTVTKVS